MSPILYFTGFLTGWTFAACMYSTQLHDPQFWRVYWGGAAGSMVAISTMFFVGLERGTVAGYYLVFVWLTLTAIHRTIRKIPTRAKPPWYIKPWFYGIPPILGIVFGLKIMEYVNDKRGFIFWFGLFNNVLVLVMYLVTFQRLNQMIARERTLAKLFPDDKDSLQ